MDKDNFKYYAFISYAREDEKWARWIQRKIETFHLPSIIRKEKQDIPKRIKPIFRDKTDLLPGLLKENLNKELEDSKFLIVVCSPVSAKSEWVGKEIKYFASLGREKNIIPFIINGIPNSNNEDTECYHQELKKIGNIKGADINEKGQENKFIKRQRAYIQIIAYMLCVNFDSLFMRHRRRIIKNIIFTSFIATIFIVFAGFSINKYSTKDIRISLQEYPPINSSLPFPKEGGIMYMSYGDKTDSIMINSINQKIIFKEIHGKFIGKTTRIRLNIFGFNKIDTKIKLSKNITIPIKRDNIYGHIYGYVKNSKSGKRESGIQIEILNYKTITDKNGKFEFYIPLEEQRKEYILTLKQRNKVIQKETIYPLSKALIEIK